MRSACALGVLALATGFANAQIETITLPWLNGDTVVVSVGTNAAGIETTRTVSTVAGVAASTTSSSTRAVGNVGNNPAEVDPNGPPTTTGPRVVGIDTTAPPMRTTTYWYDPGDGVWVSQVWTASVTAAPTVATAIVPEGTIQNYNSYQNVINSAVFKSAADAEKSAGGGALSGNIGGGTGAAGRSVKEGAAAVAAILIGAVGAGLGVLAL